MTSTPDSDKIDPPTDNSKEDEGLPERAVGENSQLKPISQARAILFSTLVVLTQSVQVSYLALLLHLYDSISDG
jgi:hypothetical protein